MRERGGNGMQKEREDEVQKGRGETLSFPCLVVCTVDSRFLSGITYCCHLYPEVRHACSPFGDVRYMALRKIMLFAPVLSGADQSGLLLFIGV